MPPFTRLTIPDLLLEEVIEHARSEAPNECCGLLAGHIEDGVGVMTARFTVANDLHSSTRYETNARDLFTAFRAMRKDNLELLAIYHSHPTSEPVPSLRDVEQNTYGETVVHLIVSLAGAKPEVRAWWLTEVGYREAEWSAV
ncbi:MAG: M67 family metallopeptidase [Planctomycetia bacterium]|nr:M67 family metallopeptidase [Planctomycetia bacterium]